jgi:hypothetical protein
VVLGLVWYFALGPGRGGEIKVTAISTPSGAEVVDGDQKSLGVTPVVVALPRGRQEVVLSFRKDGFLAAIRKVMPNQDQKLSVRLLPKQAEEKEDEPPPPAPSPAATAPPPSPPPPLAVKPAAAPPKQAAPAVARPAPSRHAEAKPHAAEFEDEPTPAAHKPKPPKTKPSKNPDTLILTPSF